MNLQQAMLQLRNLKLGLNIKTTDIIDPTRSVWSSDNWTVCTQSPSAGSFVARLDTITLGIAYYDENCGQPLNFTPPTDGIWPDYAGKIGGNNRVPLGTAITLPYAGDGPFLAVTVLDPPSFASGNKLITVTTTILVKRLKNDDLSNSLLVGFVMVFVPGNIIPDEADPIIHYTTEASIQCDQGVIEKGQSTHCTVSVGVKPVEIQNSYWWVGPNSVRTIAAAAWPGQTAG